jgi:uncharacterized membrane protein YbhN (UPF0104 family)
LKPANKMENPLKFKVWKFLKVFLKFGITAFALFWVFSNTDLTALYRNILSSNPFYILLAFVAFILSQLIASSRINIFFKAIGLRLDPFYNYKLYLLGMFYNMFLPGGIGGDGYKIFFLNKHFGLDTKKLILAKFLDKLSGVWALCCLIMLQLLFITEPNLPNGLIITILIAGTALCYILYRLFFNQFKPYFLHAHVRAFSLQLFQVICVTFILLALGFDGVLFPYLILFLASAFMALFPFTIGGLGSRELVFLYGAKYFGLDPQIGVTVSLMFFTISAICSLPGAYFTFKTSKIHPDKNLIK